MLGKTVVLTLAIFLLETALALASSVSGIVVDDKGHPLSDVHVEVVYQTFNADQLMGYGQSIKVETQTAQDGRYFIDTTHLPPDEVVMRLYPSDSLLRLVATFRAGQPEPFSVEHFPLLVDGGDINTIGGFAQC